MAGRLTFGYTHACGNPPDATGVVRAASAEMEPITVSLKPVLALVLAASFSTLAAPRAHAMPGMSAAVPVTAGTPAVQPVYWVWIHHHRYWRHHHHWHR